MRKKTLKGSQILSKLQGTYVIIEERGYDIRYEIMRGTLKECFAWIREYAPVRVSRWYSWCSRYDCPTAIEDTYCNPYDDDMCNRDGHSMQYYIDRVA